MREVNQFLCTKIIYLMEKINPKGNQTFEKIKTSLVKVHLSPETTGFLEQLTQQTQGSQNQAVALKELQRESMHQTLRLVRDQVLTLDLTLLSPILTIEETSGMTEDHTDHSMTQIAEVVHQAVVSEMIEEILIEVDLLEDQR